jgi:PAS domain S-box-containing protein
MDPTEVEIQSDSTGSGRPARVASTMPEQKRTQEDRRRGQKELHGVLAAIPDYLWSADIDSQGRVTYRYYSPGVERITGRPPEFYMLGPERWLSTVHPDDMPQVQKALQAIMTGHLPHLTEEYRIILPDQTVRWVRDNVQIRRQEGSTRLDGVVSDITAWKENQEALRRSEANLREALLAAHMGVWEWKAADGALTWDENSYRIAGRDPKSPFPDDREQARMFAPESWERLKLAGEKALSTGVPFELDLELIRPDGSKRWLIGRGKPRRDALGRFTHLRGTVQDITERRQAEEALGESEERYRRLFDQMLMGFSLVEIIDDENGHPCDYVNLEVNPAFETQTGLSPEKIRGKRIREVFPDIEPFWIETYGKVAATGESIHFENFAEPLQKWFEVTAFRIRPGRVGVSFADITARKRAEEERQQSFDQLRALAAHLQSVREEERIRVAREIHDQLGHALTAIKIDLISLVRELPDGNKPPSKRTSSIL